MTKILFLLLFSLNSLFAVSEGSEEIPKVLMETSLAIHEEQGKNYLVLSYKTAPHWHTYWKNPGDAGLPTKIQVQGLDVEDLNWPLPKRYIEKGNILAYGYEGEYSRFHLIKALKDTKLTIKSNWLICKHICVPGNVEIKASIKGGKLTSVAPQNFELTKDVLSQRLNSIITKKKIPSGMDILLKKGDKESALILYYNLPNPTTRKMNDRLGLLTPYPHELLDFKRESLYQDSKGNLYGKMTLDWDGEYAEPEYPLPADGKFKGPLTIQFILNNPIDNTFTKIEKSFTEYDLKGSAGFESLIATLKPYGGNAEKTSEQLEKPSSSDEDQSTAEPEGKSFLTYLLLAFLGGLILNVMPCVLPVISIKLFGLISHANESRARILKHNIFYTLGVLTTFLLLAAAIVILKSTGEQVGWGFQLQSPTFIAITVIVLFVFALNLFGLFEFSTPGGKSLGNIQTSSGFAGDFFGGVIATILSTPCSAPFLGTALTFAFTSSTTTIFLVFTAIGLGLAFPFLLTGFFPATIKILPKPGMWMEHVKKFLGLTLLLTMIWLLDVFISLTAGNIPLLKLLTLLIFLFFAFYSQKNIAKRTFWKLTYFAIPVLFSVSLLTSPMAVKEGTSTAGASDLLQEKKLEGLPWQKWSEEKMKELAEQNKLVFVDFTAKWCFTCKVNEKLVINTSSFKKLVDEHDIQLLLGDWTKYDPVIGAYLKKHGYVGVPAYFIQKPDGTLVALGETITIGKIKKHLN